jgi:hypothetical protein
MPESAILCVYFLNGFLFLAGPEGSREKTSENRLGMSQGRTKSKLCI